MTSFWRTWLMLWCVAVAGFGLVLAGAAFPAGSAPAQMLLDAIAGGGFELAPQMRFALSVMGAVTIGWSITLVAAIRAALLLGDRGGPIWRLVALSVIAWFVIDGALSVATGFALNLVPNTILLAAFLVPLLAAGVLGRPWSSTGAAAGPA